MVKSGPVFCSLAEGLSESSECPFFEPDKFAHSLLTKQMTHSRHLELFCAISSRTRHAPRGGGGDSHMKQTGMLVVSLRDVNFGFWSRLGCSGQSANILCRQGLI